MKTLIGITGKKRAGKDTVAKHLSKIAGVKIYSFADPLKEICGMIFQLSEEELYGGEIREKHKYFQLHRSHLWDMVDLSFGKFGYSVSSKQEEFMYHVLAPSLVTSSPSHVIIKASPRELLQRVGTNFARDHISKTIWLDLAELEYKKEGSLIIPDVRFDNEGEWIKSHGGTVVEIRKPDLENKDSHISEAGIASSFIDFTIENGGTIQELENSVDLAYDLLFQDPLVTINDLL